MGYHKHRFPLFNLSLVELSPSLDEATGGDVSPTPPRSLGASRCPQCPLPALFLLDCCPVWFPFLGIVLFPLFVSRGLQKLLHLELFPSHLPKDVLLGTCLCCGAKEVFFSGSLLWLWIPVHFFCLFAAGYGWVGRV